MKQARDFLEKQVAQGNLTPEQAKKLQPDVDFADWATTHLREERHMAQISILTHMVKSKMDIDDAIASAILCGMYIYHSYLNNTKAEEN